MHGETAAIEGLPLRLLIIVIISVIALGIIMVWFGNIGQVKGLDSVACQPKEISIPDTENDEQANITVDLVVTVYDNNNNKVSGAVVNLDGCNTQTTGVTDSSGTVTISELDVTLPPYTQSGSIRVRAEKQGYETDAEGAVLVYRL